MLCLFPRGAIAPSGLTLSFPSGAGRALRAASQPGTIHGKRLVRCRQDSPDHGAVHGAHRARQTRGMQSESMQATTSALGGSAPGGHPAILDCILAAFDDGASTDEIAARIGAEDDDPAPSDRDAGCMDEIGRAHV